jgi:hypothetical protein
MQPASPARQKPYPRRSAKRCSSWNETPGPSPTADSSPLPLANVQGATYRAVLLHVSTSRRKLCGVRTGGRRPHLLWRAELAQALLVHEEYGLTIVQLPAPGCVVVACCHPRRRRRRRRHRRRRRRRRRRRPLPARTVVACAVSTGSPACAGQPPPHTGQQVSSRG